MNLSKRFRLGRREPYLKIADIPGRTLILGAKWLARTVSQRLGRQQPSTDQLASDEYWALRDVSFEVNRGEVLGIIGRNGAGKSTLLKILSRITHPTLGEVQLRGRVGSLLEVGTGFHPELTGRENIYLNGTILGMRKAEIDRKFDRIVAFSEIEKFLDTPVKLYSSGMYMRLAFSVAAHLESEILLVDEVLAVGDVQFQKKCLGKMGEVSQDGRTVLFVSHQMNSIRRLCSRCAWINRGELRAIGDTASVVGAYELESVNRQSHDAGENRLRGKDVKFIRWSVTTDSEEPTHLFEGLGPFRWSFLVTLSRPIRNAQHGIALRDIEGTLIWAGAFENLNLEAGTHRLEYHLASLPLRAGVYTWHVSLYEDKLLDEWYCQPDLQITTPPLSPSHGLLEWRVEPAMCISNRRSPLVTHLSPFERPYQARYAEVRGEYLRSLLGTWSEARNLKTTLDIGCGHGYFSEILKERNLDVLGVDGRADNVAECRVRHPGIRFEIGNIESPEITSMGKFDFVLCFGLLYHLENPCQAIRHLFALTGQAILIEAILAPGGENTAVLFDECEGEDQGLNHIAVVPSESFLVRMLHAAGFPAVYRAKHPPVHPEFKGSVWMRGTASRLPGRPTRAAAQPVRAGCRFLRARSVVDGGRTRQDLALSTARRGRQTAPATQACRFLRPMTQAVDSRTFSHHVDHLQHAQGLQGPFRDHPAQRHRQLDATPSGLPDPPAGR